MNVIIITGIGVGWIPAVIDSTSEFKFIRESQHLLTDHRDFFIDGSTNAEGGENIEYLEYRTTSTGTKPTDYSYFTNIFGKFFCKSCFHCNAIFSGARPVYFSTLLFNGYPEDYFAQLKSAPERFVAHGILCSSMEHFYFKTNKVFTDK